MNLFPFLTYPFGGVKVDSFRILIPLSSVISYPDSLDDSAKIVSLRQTTGEVLNVKNCKFYLPTGFSNYSKHVPFTVERRRLFGGDWYLDFCVTAYNASNDFSELSYFGGCTQSGIERFFFDLAQFGFLFKPGFLALDDIFVYDVDFALDFRFLSSDVDSLVLRLIDSQLVDNKKSFVVTHEKLDGFKHSTGGYQFARKGFPFSKVFFKLYDKYIYSIKKGRFSPLLLESLKGVYRFEFTVKNSTHLNHLLSSGRSAKHFTFNQLFVDSSLRDYLFFVVFSYQFPTFFSSVETLKNKSSDIVGKDVLISWLCSIYTDGEVQKSSDLIVKFLDSPLFSRVQKTRYKKLLLDLLFK